MNEELLKDLLHLKLSLSQKVTKILPEAIYGPVKELETQIIYAIYEVSKEYLEQVPTGKNAEQAGRLKTIDVL